MDTFLRRNANQQIRLSLVRLSQFCFVENPLGFIATLYTIPRSLRLPWSAEWLVSKSRTLLCLQHTLHVQRICFFSSIHIFVPIFQQFRRRKRMILELPEAESARKRLQVIATNWDPIKNGQLLGTSTYLPSLGTWWLRCDLPTAVIQRFENGRVCSIGAARGCRSYIDEHRL